MRVSIVIPTYNRTQLLMERSLPSCLAQTHPDIEVIVVGDGTEQATVDAMAEVTDPRVTFVNLPRADYPDNANALWCAGGVPPFNHGLDIATGDWVTMLGDDDELMPRHAEILLALAEETEAGCVYGRAEVVGHGFLGWWPPRYGGLTNALWKASYGYRWNPDCWKVNLAADWELWSRMLADGVKFAFTEEVVYRYFPAHRVPGTVPA
jgi:glycosyltransferase involved in cell wall biosynthesis